MKRIIVILLLGVVSVTSLYAQAELARAKAMLTLNFMRYIGWPDDARQGDFVIGVVRDREAASWLKKLSAGKKLGFQDIVVKEYKGVDDLEGCQLVYMSQSSNFVKNADKVKAKLAGKGALIVTEVEGATDKGSMINFVIRDDKLKFELHGKNAQDAGIAFSAKLQQLTGAINL